MKIGLRALELNDLSFLVKWRNDVEITSTLGGNRFFVSNLREESWIRNSENDRTSVRLIIEDLETSSPLGLVNLTSISWINRSAEFSIFIGEKQCQGKGAGHSASKLMLEYAFNELNLERVYLYALEDNKRAIELYKKLGFIQEGCLINSVFKNGKYNNLVLMALIRKGWLLM